MEPDEHAVRAAHAAWIEAVNAEDLASLLGMVTDDVVFIGPGRSPADRGRFADGISALFRQSRLESRSEMEEVVVVGEVAYTRSRDTFSVTPRAGGVGSQLAGHRMCVYRKQPDGRWLLARYGDTLSPL